MKGDVGERCGEVCEGMRKCEEKRGKRFVGMEKCVGMGKCGGRYGVWGEVRGSVLGCVGGGVGRGGGKCVEVCGG